MHPEVSLVAVLYHRVRVIGRNDQVVPVEPTVFTAIPPWGSTVSQQPARWSIKTADRPPFERAVPFVTPPEQTARRPFYRHDHCPAITWCDTGDLPAA